MNTTRPNPKPVPFGANLRDARDNADLTQAQLAARVGVTRSRIARIEVGNDSPDFALAVELAKALNVPLEKFASGRLRPSRSFRGIAIELRHLGVHDLRLSDPSPPGAFRPAEEVLVLATRGDRPSPRVIDALPYVLSRREFDPHLLLAYSRRLDPRVRRRLAWLADVTLVLTQSATFPATESTAGLERLLRLVERPAPTDPEDDLGYPSSERPPLLWRRWRVRYATTLDGFAARAAELAGAAT